MKLVSTKIAFALFLITVMGINNCMLSQSETEANCNLPPSPGIIRASLSDGCAGMNTEIILKATGYSPAQTGLEYRWQKSSNGTSGWSNITGESNPAYADYTTNATTFFRLAATCTLIDETTYSNVVEFTVSVCNPYSLGETSGTISTCNALFYDSGGTSDYSNSESGISKFCSNNGSHLRVEFFNFDTEDNGEFGRYQVMYDILRVWDGPNTSANPMFEFSGLQTTTNQVPVIISSGECLCFKFVSDEVITKPGWVAHISCTTEEPNIASQFCMSAPNICNLDGYQGATSNFYNVERVYDQIQDEGALFPGLAALDNNSFITFVAAASTVVLNIDVSNCSGGFSDPSGIQFAVYKGSNCNLNSLVSSSSYIDPGLEEGLHNIVIPNLTVGQTYYLMTDGNYGAICDYTISAQSGVSLAKVNPTQNTICEGETATITASGGTGFHWSGPNGFSSTQATINVTLPGIYTVTITGGLSACPSEVVLNSLLNVIENTDTPVFNIPSVYCKGAVIPALPTTSLNGITGVWSPALNNTHTTTYNFNVNGGMCSEPYSHTITISPDISVSSVQADCFGGNGKLIFSSTSQQLPLTYKINGIMAQSPAILPAGTYTVIVTDVNGCTASKLQSISQPNELEVVYELTDRSCFGYTDADVKIMAEGGTEPYYFTLLSGEINLEGEEHFNLTETEYTLLVKDSKNCSAQEVLYIYEPAPLFATYISHNPTCIGNIDGLIEVFTTGGTEPYIYKWDNKQVDIPFVSGLREGVYDISVVDANECSFTINAVNLTDIELECLSIPNAFSPNGDGINDIWIIENLEIYLNSYLYVYNRWGQIVYSGLPNEKWNGKYNDQFVPAGPYIYLLTLNDGTEALKGIVTVIY